MSSPIVNVMRRPGEDASNDAGYGDVLHAESLVDLGRGAEALQVLARVFAARSDDASVHLVAARAHLASNDGPSAWKHATEAVRREPQSPRARAILSLALKACGNGRRAVEEAEVAVRLAPYDTLGYTALVLGLLDRPDTKERARATARVALALAPEDPDLLVLLAQSHIYNGKDHVWAWDRRQARRYLLEALAASPGHSDALRELATLRAMGWSPVGSMRDHAGLLRENPLDQVSHSRMAFAFARLTGRGHVISWLLVFVMRGLVTRPVLAETMAPAVVGFLAAAVLVGVAWGLRRALGVSLIPAARRWAEEDRLGALWLMTLVALDLCLVITSLDPTGWGPAWATAALGLLFVGAAISWIRRGQRS